MKQKRRILSIILSLCMVVSILSGMTLSVAAENAAVTVTVNENVVLSSAEPYYVNGEATADGKLGTSGCTAYFDSENGILKLNEYNAGAIRSSGDLTIVLSGNNYIYTSSQLAIMCVGALKITSENKNDEGIGTGELQIVSSKGGIYGNNGIQIDGLHCLFIFGADGSGIMSGVGKDISISKLAKLSVIGTCKAAVCSSGGKAEINANAIEFRSDANYAVTTGSEDVLATVSANISLIIEAGENGKIIYPLSSTVSAAEKVFTEHEKDCSKIEYGLDKRKNVEISIETINGQPFGEQQDYSVEYTGDVVQLAFSAKNDEGSLVNLEYSIVWRNANGSVLTEVPIGIGEYEAEVFGENSEYSATNLFGINIVPGNASDFYETSLNKKITVGNNIILLPEIPSEMAYGTPTECDENGGELAEPHLTDMIISRNQLSVKTDRLQKDVYYLNVPVAKASDDAKCNYNDYNIMITLTKADTPLFDLCNGSELKTTADEATAAIDSAWNVGEHIAFMADNCNYRLEGWYTAPNGWGEKIADEKGNLIGENNFEIAKTYYAHWVWTRSIVDADGDFPQVGFIYGCLKEPKTVYTTGLDFTQDALEADGSGYSWNSEDKTLTLSGVQIVSQDAMLGIVLPSGSTVELASNTYDHYEKEDGTSFEGKTYTDAENTIICKHIDNLPVDIYSVGDLTIKSDTPASELESERRMGNCIYTLTGGVFAAGNLSIENGKMITRRLLANGDITLSNVIVDSYSYEMSVENDADLYNITSYEGSITVENGTMYVGNLISGKDISIFGDDCHMYVANCIWADENLSISDFGADSEVIVALENEDTDGKYGCIYADTLTISNAAVDSRAFCITKKAKISNSTVNVKNLGDSPALDVGEKSEFTNSKITVSEVRDGEVGIEAISGLTINGGTTTVTAADGAKMLSAIMVIGDDSGDGLVLNNAEITVPSDGKTEQKTLSFGNDDVICRLWLIGNNSSEVKITPTSSRTSSSAAATRYTVDFNTNGGSKISSVSVNKNSTVSKPSNPTKDGYTFGGWYSDKDCKNAYDFSAKVTKSITLYAKWVENEKETAEPSTSEWKNPFADVKKSDWFYDAVQRVASAGIVSGVSDSSYEPNATLTRAMFITMLHRYAGKPSADYAMSYTDITDSWYTEAVRWASSVGVVTGFDSLSFGPNEPITREQAAAMLKRYAELANESNPAWNETNILSYDDFESISEWAIPSVQWAAGAGIMKGRTEKTINPSENITRAEIAQMFVNYIDAVRLESKID